MQKFKRLKEQKAITLVALVITIIILLILAAISIQALTNQGLFKQAQNAKNLTEEKTAEEKAILDSYEEQLGIATGAKEYTAATTIAEAQTNDMLAKKVNSSIVDAYGNKITVPAGFKITGDATTVDKGIVIIDSNKNEFVWIPVGTIYTATEHTEANTKTIELGRYSFASDGKPSAYSGSFVEEDSTDTANLKNYGNTIAKDINTFKTKASAAQSGGFYIGRYEARTTTARSAKTDPITTLTTKASDYVYNYVTQIQAADLARNMYKDSTKFTSDLMNSYAWDTATLFLQTFGDNSTYSRQTRVSSSYASTGTNNQTTKDVQCNVYDMASNCYEWTTETCNTDMPCILRGGLYNNNNNYTSDRNNYSTSGGRDTQSFRLLLYVDV